MNRSDMKVALTVAGLSGVAGVAMTWISVERIGPYVALAAPPLALAVLLRRRLQPLYLSPVWIMVLTLTTTGLFGYMFRRNLAGLGGGGIRLDIDESLAERTAYLFAAVAGAIVAGAAAVAMWRKPREASVVLHAPSRRVRDLCLLACAVPTVLVIIGAGSQILNRPEHLAEIEGTSVLAVAGQLSLGAVALCGYLAGADRGMRRFAAVSLALTYFVLYFSFSTRRLALFPLLFAVGWAVASTGRRRGWIIAVGAAASAAVFPLPLFLRGLDRHGLEPYLANLGDFSYANVDWPTSVNNILISFPITAHSAYVQSPLPHSWLWIELNPLPGTLAGWYQITPYLRLNGWTPFSSVGELGNYGLWAIGLVGIGLGVVLAYLDGRVGAHLQEGRQFLAVGLTGMSALIAAVGLQYSTRTVTRLILYVLLLEVGLRLWRSTRDSSGARQDAEVQQRAALAAQARDAMARSDPARRRPGRAV